MPRLYYRGERFDEIAPKALAEAEFERLLVQNSEVILPDAVAIPFKKTVYSAEASARADLAMISTDYRYWVVVEVELEGHSLYNHVIPQVRTLRDAAYRADCVEYFLRKRPNLDRCKLTQMLMGDPPEILVLVNKANEEWRRELRRYGVHMVVFDIYRSRNNRHIFLVEGEAPRLEHSFLTELYWSLMPRCLVVASPASLAVPPRPAFPILIEGQVTYWETFQTGTEVYLTPVGQMPLDPDGKYALVKEGADQYTIHPRRPRRISR